MTAPEPIPAAFAAGRGVSGAARAEGRRASAGGLARVADGGTPEGLVICAITARGTTSTPETAGQTGIRGLWDPAFPTSDLVDLAAQQLVSLAGWNGHEGPRFRIVVSPGALAIESRDAARAERAYERQLDRDAHTVEELTAYLAEHGEFPEDRPSRSEITGWSRRSRARMVRRLCELDYSPMLADTSRIPAMITLTYPGDWKTVAPNGKATKKHQRAFQERWKRAWGQRLVGIWKLEFQRRGAPHLHIFAVPPHGTSRDGRDFRTWLSETWADVVAHPDPEERRRHVLAGTGIDFAEGLRARDPRRLAVYFAKHGTFAAKEYQHQVPEEWQQLGAGPGRFWGYWGLEPATAAVEIDPHMATDAARVMRRWAAAQGTTRRVTVVRTSGGVPRSRYPQINSLAGAAYETSPGKVRYRNVRRPVKRLPRGRGWISLNDAPAFASALARHLAPLTDVETTTDRRARLIAATGVTLRV